MIPLSPDHIEALAAEYVLGTQSGRVRRRMETLIKQEPGLADRVEYWQNQLNQLSEQAWPVPVPPWVWRRIEAELQPPTPESRSWWQDLLVWRWTAGLATAMAVLLAVLPTTEQAPITTTAPGGVVLVLTDEESNTAWLVSRQSFDAPIKAQAVAVPLMTVEQAYELWLLPAGGAPLSLGLLNE